MIWQAAGLYTGSVKLHSFKPITIMAVKWTQGADGYWRGRDRGESLDRYETELRFMGTYADMWSVHDEMTVWGVDHIQPENESEKNIFGLNYYMGSSAPTQVAILKVSELRNLGDKTFEFSVRLRAAKADSYESSEIHEYLPRAYVIDQSVNHSETNNTVIDSLDGTQITVSTHYTFSGVFYGMIRFYSWANAAKFKSTIFTTYPEYISPGVYAPHYRGCNFRLYKSNFHLGHNNWLPFGRNTNQIYDAVRDDYYSWAKCIELDDLGPSSLTSWDFNIKLVHDRYVAV